MIPPMFFRFSQIDLFESQALNALTMRSFKFVRLSMNG